MDEEANLANPAEASDILARPIRPVPDTNRPVTSSSSSSSLTSSPPDFLRNVQAAFKRHRRLVPRQLNSIRPSRMMLSDHNISRSSDLSGIDIHYAKTSPDFSASNKGDPLKDSNPPSSSDDTVSVEGELDSSSDLPSVSGYNAVHEDMNKQLDAIEHQNKPLKEVQSSLAKFSGFDDHIPSKKDHLSSHLSSLALTEMELDVANPSSDIGHNLKLSEVRSDVMATSSLEKRIAQVEDNQKHSRALLHGESNQAMTHGSVCTTTLMNSASAPMISANTSCRDFDLHHEPLSRGDVSRPGKDMHGAQPQAQEHPRVVSSKENLCQMDDINARKDHSLQDERPTKEKEHACDPMVDPCKHEKQEKPACPKGTSSKSKKNYDPDSFFKVNGKLYQRLGKIGSGGSSEVHKVISSDCTIFALKKIKLRGRDYATAFGFCQEIEYLNRLKGKSNIIQLIDYEVTDKVLLQEVMSGTMSNKDGRLKEDGYIYMVLEYGEIDLAHMLSQKWKEMDGCDQKIDENWLRFYWQQILLAVNTIHEERIVHSDLKPANFLLVKGFLKLIDFGIAKAIMSDTTNIQRDAQVGTLSYMSPEAFMCNESDSNGNTIKCGRPSDIWSLGCILYQMVYGRTPFSEYKTFWAKFKVITNPNHEIVYRPVSNPLLLDLMKKCLAWDRSERWRIPQLLQHPFLVPPVLPREPLLLQLVADGCVGNHEAWELYLQLMKLVGDPFCGTDMGRSGCCQLLSEISNVCAQLQSHLSE